MQSRERRFFVLAGALLAAFFVVAQHPAAAAAAKHVYVSGANDAYVPDVFDARVVAYALADGRLAPQPDRIYQHTAGPIALGPQGELYASQFGCTIAVFAPDSTRVERTLELLPPLDCGSNYYHYWDITALTVDSKGYVYVSLAVIAGSAIAGKKREPSGSTYGCSASFFDCTLVYAPGSSGLVSPLFQIAPDASSVPTGALAVASNGDLYLQDKPNAIDVYAHAATNPTLVRTFEPAGLYDASNPVVSGALLYVQVQQCPDGPSGACLPGVAVFPLSANGVVKPERLFTLPVAATWWDIAVSDAALYAGAGGPTLQAFHKTASGIVMPLFTSFLYPIPTFPQYVEIGR